MIPPQVNLQSRRTVDEAGWLGRTKRIKPRSESIEPKTKGDWFIKDPTPKETLDGRRDLIERWNWRCINYFDIDFKLVPSTTTTTTTLTVHRPAFHRQKVY